jgi:hypothetical protein
MHPYYASGYQQAGLSVRVGARGWEQHLLPLSRRCLVVYLMQLRVQHAPIDLCLPLCFCSDLLLADWDTAKAAAECKPKTSPCTTHRDLFPQAVALEQRQELEARLVQLRTQLQDKQDAPDSMVGPRACCT